MAEQVNAWRSDSGRLFETEPEARAEDARVEIESLAEEYEKHLDASHPDMNANVKGRTMSAVRDYLTWHRVLDRIHADG